MGPTWAGLRSRNTVPPIMSRQHSGYEPQLLGRRDVQRGLTAPADGVFGLMVIDSFSGLVDDTTIQDLGPASKGPATTTGG
jgi:hypothetical protein